MKKTTLALLFTASTFLVANGQISISQSNMPAIGNVLNWATDNSGSITSPGSSGASQTWNFSTLAASTVDTIHVVSTASTPSTYANQYPGANLAFKYSNTGANEALYEYYNSSSASINLQGIVFNSSAYGIVQYKFSKSWGIYSLPATYKSHWKGSYRAVMKTYDASGGGIIDSVEVIENGTYTDTIDSWGNMTTPSGTFNSIRDMHLENDLDSTYYYESGNWVFGGAYTSKNNFYSWYTNQANFNYMLVEMNVDSTGKATQLNWLDNKVVGINEIVDNNNTVSFPNPATSELTIKTESLEKGVVKVYDIAGQLIEMDELTNNKTVINTSEYKNGMYFYTLSDSDGNIIGRNKFAVSK
ncbi:MAG TPA: T9SS type A sorting domain-containing protein [Bacteroidia bacterium]|jgi:hypothetical protein|nr:T9SS type A sorting domain-containing protein [Bacteroidia bacterium]